MIPPFCGFRGQPAKLLAPVCIAAGAVNTKHAHTVIVITDAPVKSTPKLSSEKRPVALDRNKRSVLHVNPLVILFVRTKIDVTPLFVGAFV